METIVLYKKTTRGDRSWATLNGKDIPVKTAELKVAGSVPVRIQGNVLTYEVSGDIEKCVLCGMPDQDKQSDHLRECYKLAQGKLSTGQFHPRLYDHEMSKLKQGSNPICSNLEKCRNRRAKL